MSALGLRRRLGGLLLALGLGAAGNAAAQTVPPPAALTAADVGQVIAQAVNEATARGAKTTIAVVDRVGNVLAVFQMTGAAATFNISSGRGIPAGNGLEQINIIPSTLAAIAKAITGAYLSSNGNAFTTRTASQIVQEHFNVGELDQPGGPLFGVQFSQLPCSDFVNRFGDGSAMTGPKRSPLGLSADPGGLPLYKNGVLAGGVGVLSDGVYGLDLNIRDIDTDQDELIAVAGQVGFTPPDDIRADKITVNGKTFRYVDRGPEALKSNPAAAPAFAAITGGVAGTVVAVTGYSAGGAPIAGTAYGTPASGYAPAVVDGVSAVVLVNAAGANRFPAVAGTDGAAALTANEVTKILSNALKVAYAGRAQIRRPLGTSNIQVTISVVDTKGVPLGIARTVDAPVFGTDVSLQKARSTMFFSNPLAAADLTATGGTIPAYVTAMKAFVGPTALSDGVAYGDTTIGLLARPFYPDGIDGNPNGPLSKPLTVWSPFNDGLQLDLVQSDIVNHVLFVAGAKGADVPAFCVSGAGGGPALPAAGVGATNRLANGLQIFSGSVPIFRGATLVGGIGISGDGILQDNMVSFLGLDRAATELATGVGNAPQAIRSDNLTVQGLNLRFVICPNAPFLNSNVENVCEGK